MVNYKIKTRPRPPCLWPLASARQHPETQKGKQAGHSPERAVEGPTHIQQEHAKRQLASPRIHSGVIALMIVILVRSFAVLSQDDPAGELPLAHVLAHRTLTFGAPH